jgi:hypothetical protein
MKREGKTFVVQVIAEYKVSFSEALRGGGGGGDLLSSLFSTKLPSSWCPL